MSETWKPVNGYEGSYEVSDQGNVRSLDRQVMRPNGPRIARGCMMKLKKDINGYLVLKLWKENQHRTHRVSRMVAEAFIPNPDSKSQVNHIDGDKLNNHATNLEWSTPKENSQHAFDTGLSQPMRGERHAGSKLTNEQAKAIYILAHLGNVKQDDIAKRFGVTQNTVASIKTRRSWRSVTEALCECLEVG